MNRVSVHLITDAATALTDLRARTGLSQTDIVNRALQMYAFIDDETRSGQTIILRAPDGTDQVVKIR